MSRRRAPRRLSEALGPLVGELAPDTPLAAVQSVWKRAAGEAIAAHASPAWEREGVVGVVCDSATWAAELNLIQGRLTERLNELLGGPRVSELRCSTE